MAEYLCDQSSKKQNDVTGLEIEIQDTTMEVTFPILDEHWEIFKTEKNQSSSFMLIPMKFYSQEQDVFYYADVCEFSWFDVKKNGEVRTFTASEKAIVTCKTSWQMLKNYKSERFAIRFTNSIQLYARARKAIIRASSSDYENIFDSMKAQTTVYQKRIENDDLMKKFLDEIEQSPPHPYLLYGPAGTGKTTWAMQALKRLIDADKKGEKTFLLTGPSNFCCDTIVEKLLKAGIDSSLIFQYYSKKYLKRTSNVNHINLFRPMQANVTGYVKIYVATLQSSLQFESILNNFDYIFIDESCLSTVPETLIPIVNFGRFNGKSQTRVILIGDPNQLKPLIKSRVAKFMQYEISYFQWLKESPLYCTKNSRHIFTLVNNYRTDERILRLSNEMFYGGALVAKKTSPCRHYLEKIFPFPVFFFVITGTCVIDEQTRSVFNREEASTVEKVVKNILRLEPSEEIAIIAPYNAQTLEIKNRLAKEVKTKNIRINTVEYFQGREANVVIISTSISSKFTEETSSFLGELGRLNVMLTRAKCYLIVIGNPFALSNLNAQWKMLFRYCHLNNSIDTGGVNIDKLLKEEIDAGLLERLMKRY